MSNTIRFAHLADLHLGAWREKILTELNFQTFKQAIDKIINQQVDFVLFAGDIFNTPMPSLEIVEKVTKELMRLKHNEIPLYVIGGSHDYSPLGKSFIQLLETAGVFIDVAKWETIDKGQINLILTKDPKTKTILGGVLGKKKGLDKNIYSNLNALEIPKDELSIFMFHCTLNDFKPDFMKTVDVEAKTTYLPKGFKYYAGGHIHTHMQGEYAGEILTYPGPLFPNNFRELKLETSSFNLCEYNKETKKINIERIFIQTYDKVHLKIESDKLNPLELQEKINKVVDNSEIEKKIVLLEISGIVEGKISDIKIQNVVSNCYSKGALQVLKNTYKLTSSLVDKSKIDITGKNNIEETFLKQELFENQEQYNILKTLLSLDLSKQEEEKVSDYEKRLSETVEKVLKIN